MKEQQENLLEEQHGTMPEFINKKRWNKRMAVIALTMLTQIVAAMLYISYPNEKVNISAIIFLLASIGMKKLLANSANWYVTKKDVTLKTIRTTMIAQKCLVLADLTAWVLIAFTPIWCMMFQHYISYDMLYFRICLCAHDLRYDLFADVWGWIIGMYTIAMTAYAAYQAYVIAKTYGKSRGTAHERLDYTLRCEENGTAKVNEVGSSDAMWWALCTAFFLAYFTGSFSRMKKLEFNDQMFYEWQWEQEESHRDTVHYEIKKALELSEPKKDAVSSTYATHHSSHTSRNHSHDSSYYDDEDDDDAYNTSSEDDDDDDTWYRDEDDADEKYEYDYWE